MQLEKGWWIMKYLSFANRVLKDILFEIVIVIIDLSGSMNTSDWKPSRKAGAVKANKELIRVKAQNYPKDMVGIIGFGTDAELLHEPFGLAGGDKSLYKALTDLPDMGYTNFAAALKLAEACLFGKPASTTKTTARKKAVGFLSWLLYDQTYEPSHHITESISNDNCLRRIILLTDGDYNEGGSPMKVACRLKNKGVLIDCIGIGGKPADIKEDTLKEIASRNTDGSIRYCFIGDQEQLIRKYENLAHHIRPV